MNHANFEKILKIQSHITSKVIKKQLQLHGVPTEVWRLKNPDYANIGGMADTIEDVYSDKFDLIGQFKILLYNKGLSTAYVYNDKEVNVIYYTDMFNQGDVLVVTFNKEVSTFQIKEPVKTAQRVVYQYIAVPINFHKSVL